MYFYNLRFEVLIAVKMWILVFWVVKLCNVVGGYQHSSETLVTTCKIILCYNPEDQNRHMIENQQKWEIEAYLKQIKWLTVKLEQMYNHTH
jgi:hypothetical protein